MKTLLFNRFSSQGSRAFAAMAGVLALFALACTSTGASPAPAGDSQPGGIDATEPSAPAENTQPSAQPAASEPLLIQGSDPCALVTGAQVETAFGLSVSEAAPGGPGNTSSFSQGCEYTISEYTSVEINIYQGDGAKNYYALLITASGRSCDELFERFFDAAFAPLTEMYPSADAALASLPLDELYRRYVGALGNCMYVHSQDRPDAGSNVLNSSTRRPFRPTWSRPFNKPAAGRRSTPSPIPTGRKC
jgi:hypothetical protein